MPGSGLFRVQEIKKSERLVNVEVERVRPDDHPA
jgi:hypothetical protein